MSRGWYITDGLPCSLRPCPSVAPTAMLDFGFTFSDMNYPVLVTGHDSNCTSIAWTTFSICCLYPLPSVLNENPRPALEAATVIGTSDGAFQAQTQAQTDNTQDPFGSLLNFGSNEHHGLSGFSPFQSSLSVLIGAPIMARTSVRSVLYNKTGVIVINQCNL